MEISNDINNLNLDQIELYKILSKKINCSDYDKLSERIAKTYSLTICLINRLNKYSFFLQFSVRGSKHKRVLLLF